MRKPLSREASLKLLEPCVEIVSSRIVVHVCATLERLRKSNNKRHEHVTLSNSREHQIFAASEEYQQAACEPNRDLQMFSCIFSSFPFLGSQELNSSE